VCADGAVVVVNAHQHPDLFWALRGGGGGTFGIVSRMTMRTHPMPASFGAAIGTITARDAIAYRKLLGVLVPFVRDHLDDPHWGEQIRCGPDNTLQVTLLTVDLSDDEARLAWAPLLEWVTRQGDAYDGQIEVVAMPFTMWDADWWDATIPDFIVRDARTDATRHLYWWAANQGEVSQHIDAYRSRWLPASAFAPDAADRLAEALYAASRRRPFTIHLNKGLSGAHPDAAARVRNTSINPRAFEAVGLLIMASVQPLRFPGRAGHEPDTDAGRAAAREIDAAMQPILAVTPDAGSYLNETDYFEVDWQRSFWGTHYERLLAVKRRYDPTNLFRVHHGVGSELSPQ
jgi:FAD/FMN-containing dehydrogenase